MKNKFHVTCLIFKDDEVVKIEVLKPLNNIEYPVVEVSEIEVNEDTIFDAYKLDISVLKEKNIEIKQKLFELKFIQKSSPYKWLFYMCLILFLFVSVFLYLKL